LRRAARQSLCEDPALFAKAKLAQAKKLASHGMGNGIMEKKAIDYLAHGPKKAA